MPTVSAGVQTETGEGRDRRRRDSTRGGRGRAGQQWRDVRHALRHAKRDGARAVRLHGMTFWMPTKAPTLTTSVGAQTGEPAAPPVPQPPLNHRRRRNARRQREFFAAKDAAKVAAAMPILLAEATAALPTSFRFGQALETASTQFSESSLARMRDTAVAMDQLSLAGPPAAVKRPAEASPGSSPDKAAEVEAAAESGATRQDYEVDEARGIRALRHAPKMKKKLEGVFGGARRNEEREPPAAAQ